ncbi:hypothetical protein ES708_01938 [subsurface metagenome]
MHERKNRHTGDTVHMNKAKVSIVRAHDYDYAEIYAAVGKGIKLIGGLAKIVPPGSKVFVKINHLPPPSPAEKGIITHPVFVEVVLGLLKEAGADITVGDDITSGAGDGFQVSGFRQMCQRAGVRLTNLREAGFVETVCNGHFLDKVYLSKISLDADVIINLPKLKTHSLCVFTGGVKNMYGNIPSGLRQKFHAEYMRSEDFSQVLTDIFSTIRPQLTIMDGIIAMEGEGPAAGSLRRLGVILTSQDTVAVDAVATKIIGLNPMDIHTTRYSDERGLGIGNLQNIEVIGERIDDVMVADFKLPAGVVNTLARRMPRVLPRFILDQLSIKPSVIEHRCSGCSECEKICPVGAISVSGETAKIDYGICIQCMCCHEVCRFNAIVPKQPIIGSTIQFLANILRKLRATAG